jgi:hypothetical protein
MRAADFFSGKSMRHVKHIPPFESPVDPRSPAALQSAVVMAQQVLKAHPPSPLDTM